MKSVLWRKQAVDASKPAQQIRPLNNEIEYRLLSRREHGPMNY